MLVGMLSAGIGYGTFAYFNDSQTSNANIFTAGTLALTLGGAQNVNAFIGASNFAPGDTVSGSLTLTNAGTISAYDAEGHAVDLTISASEGAVDRTGAPIDMGRVLEITAISYDGASMLAGISDANLNGWKDLSDLEAAGAKTVADPGAAGKVLSLTVRFHPTAANEYQGARDTLAFTFNLAQH